MKRTILILNDEPDMRRMLRRVLEREDFDCHEAGTDDEALQILRNEPIHLIAQDMARGDKGKADGARFTGLLKSDPELRDIPVVIMSAATKEQVATIFEGAGISFEEAVAGYRRIPFHYQALLMDVELVLVCQQISVKSTALAQSLGNHPALFSELAELKRQALAQSRNSNRLKCHHGRIDLLRWIFKKRMHRLTRLVDSLDSGGVGRAFQ